jgi:phytoene synthase
MLDDSTLRAAYRECRRLATRHYENFPVASWLVPRAERKALAAIYAFARGADDFADEPGQGSREARLQALQAWRRKLDDCCHGRAEGPLWIALADTIENFRLSHEHFENLICAFESDVRTNRHRDFASLLAYCRCSANPVGRLVLELFGHRDPELFALSDQICTGLQLANFWQDVLVDLERDRIYLPLGDLEHFNYRLEDLNARRVDDRWRRLMAFEIARTREFFKRGEPLPVRVRPELRRQLRLTWLGGTKILDRIEAADYDVFRRRPSFSQADFVRMYLRARSSLTGDGGAKKASQPPRAGPRVHERLTNARITNFYYSFVFLPREKRRAIEALYAFARRGDDLADGSLARQEALAEIERYRQALAACYAADDCIGKSRAEAARTDDLSALADAVRRFNIPRQYFEDLIRGFEMDLGMDGRRPAYKTFDELARYCYHVAGTIGLMAIEIFGYRSPRTRDYALNLGTALQLVNILRDVQSDARRGRVYLPREDLERFGVEPNDLAEGRYTPSFVELMRFECERAESYFDAARRNLSPEDRRSMVAAEIMGAIYRRLLKRLRARRYNVFGKRLRLSRPLKFWIALSAYIGAEWYK